MLDVCLLGCGGMMPLPRRWLATAASICTTGSVIEFVIILPIIVDTTVITIPITTITIKIITVHQLAMLLDSSNFTWKSFRSIFNFSPKFL